jgi:hypothetical protein
MTSPDEHTVGAFRERVEDELRVNTSGTHHTDDANIRFMLQSRNPGEIGRCVGTPIAEECDNLRFPAVGIGFCY